MLPNWTEIYFILTIKKRLILRWNAAKAGQGWHVACMQTWRHPCIVVWLRCSVHMWAHDCKPRAHPVLRGTSLYELFKASIQEAGYCCTYSYSRRRGAGHQRVWVVGEVCRSYIINACLKSLIRSFSSTLQAGGGVRGGVACCPGFGSVYCGG